MTAPFRKRPLAYLPPVTRCVDGWEYQCRCGAHAVYRDHFAALAQADIHFRQVGCK